MFEQVEEPETIVIVSGESRRQVVELALVSGGGIGSFAGPSSCIASGAVKASEPSRG